MRLAIYCTVASLSLIPCHGLLAGERTISVYVALADNEHQGIVPVPKAIGNGEDPERNLYWGTAEGLKGCFDKSQTWKRAEQTESAGPGDILRTRMYRHTGTNAVLYARAYRGSAIRQCIRDFESAVQTNGADLVVFIGHNGLMDFELPALKAPEAKARRTDCIVLCCHSEAYFKTRLEAAGGRPILLTTQRMYPGAFILHAVIEPWLKGADLSVVRASAGAAYARNQKLSGKAAAGVFSDLKE